MSAVEDGGETRQLWYQSHKEATTFILQQQDSMAFDNNFVQPVIPHFDGHYDHWSMLMENFLISKEYWPIVESVIQVPATDAALTDAIGCPILETILSKETSKDIWDSMKKKYQGSTRVKRAQLQALRRDFETLQMKDGESVTSYCARTMEISNKMRFHGEKMGDVTNVEKILHSLTPKFDYVVCSIEESKDIDAFSLDELQSSLLVHEQKMNRKDKEREAQSNFAEKQEVETLLMVVQVNQEPESDICFGDSSTVKVMGNGNIKIRTKNGSVEIISNVLYAPDLKSNLLSVGQLQEKGYVITIQKGVLYKLFNPQTKKIVTSRDVVFDEESYWDWNMKQPTQALFDNDSEIKPTSTVSTPENSAEDSSTVAEILPTAAEILPTTAEATDTVEIEFEKSPCKAYS
ncbi:hypothetical protein ZIOFF_066128 [Zingiber officinale]|uniref:Retrovirus-related Pol polyprotein from transposon TNT 1-94-like beta-barrel domain-containing protein n=1 Tax=Zingiber officinale TaxID=94328 RepID=A0A8J5K951_ZINOF|nr:hypothetical protein ZIOFF_066128 [Zingiber officinale]